MIFIARIIAERFLKQLFYLASTVLVFKKTLLVAMSYKATLMCQTFDMSKMLIISRIKPWRVRAANGPDRKSSTWPDHHFLLPNPRSGSELQALGKERPATIKRRSAAARGLSGHGIRRTRRRSEPTGRLRCPEQPLSLTQYPPSALRPPQQQQHHLLDCEYPRVLFFWPFLGIKVS